MQIDDLRLLLLYKRSEMRVGMHQLLGRLQRTGVEHSEHHRREQGDCSDQGEE